MLEKRVSRGFSRNVSASASNWKAGPGRGRVGVWNRRGSAVVQALAAGVAAAGEAAGVVGGAGGGGIGCGMAGDGTGTMLAGEMVPCVTLDGPLRKSLMAAASTALVTLARANPLPIS